MYVLNLGQSLSPGNVLQVHETGAADTDTVITIDAVANHRVVLQGIQWSYDQAPTGGKLTIEDGAGNTIFEVDITAAADRYNSIRTPLISSINTDCILTLAAGGGTVVGKLNIQYNLYSS